MTRRTFLAASAAAFPLLPAPRQAIEVGRCRQLFFDDYFFASQRDVRLVLHPPQPREIVLRCDRPWERKVLHYSCVLRDGGRFRMWYRAAEGDPAVVADKKDRTWSLYA